jgi:hypothetical protein
MNLMTSGNRIVVIGRTAPIHEKTSHREPSKQRARSQRIVIIRDGRLVRGRPGRRGGA